MKYFFLILLFCALLAKDTIAKRRHKKHHSKKTHGTKIIGGNDVTIQEYNYQAYLFIDEGGDDIFECGGVIISGFYILTAAHCFEGVIQSVTARIGSSNNFEGGRQYRGEYAYHEDYNTVTLDYDIAYFKSHREMKLDGIHAKAIAIIEEGTSIPSGTMIKISGWGDTSEDGDDSDILRATEVPTLSNEECNAKPGYAVTERQFCGGFKEGGKDHCDGDSGGPAVIADSNILAGLVSGGFACGKPDTPGIYVNITDPPIRSWILQHTGV